MAFRIPNSEFLILPFEILDLECQRAVIRDIPEGPILLARTGDQIRALPTGAVEPRPDRIGHRSGDGAS